LPALQPGRSAGADELPQPHLGIGVPLRRGGLGKLIHMGTVNLSLTMVLFASALLGQEQLGQQEPAVDDACVLAATINRFAAAFADQLATADANLCVAPASVSLGLLMLLPGARGETAAELQRRLCPANWDAERTAKAAGLLLQRLRRSKKVDIAVANDLWLQTGTQLQPRFAAALQRDFGAGPRAIDFAGDPGAARTAINDQVAGATHDRIKDLVPADALTARTRLVTTNALWVLAKWRFPFDADDTYRADFRLPSGDKVRVPMMHQQWLFGYAESDGVQVLRLLCEDPDFALDVALPGPKATLMAALGVLCSPQRDQASLPATRVQIGLPGFRVESACDCLPVLRRLGIERAITDKADFSGIDGKAGLCVTAAAHKALLLVDEKGTEAAAATDFAGSVGTAEAAALPPVPFVADHPFAFALRDLKTGLLLFVGQVVDPR
jgi:serpin B